MWWKKSGTGLMLTRLMEYSELQVSETAKFGAGYQRQMAGRVIDSVITFRRWEDSHSQLMRGLVAERKLDHQALAVRRLALSMIHRKAPFECLRDQHVVGADRHRFFQALYGQHDYAAAMVREHQTYLLSGCSVLCVERFCAPATWDRILRYKECYAAYMRAYTSRLLADAQSAEREQYAALLVDLRDDLQQARVGLLGSGPTRADVLSFERLREVA